MFQERFSFVLLSAIGLSTLFLLVGRGVGFSMVWHHYGSEGFFWIVVAHAFVVVLALGIVETLADKLKFEN